MSQGHSYTANSVLKLQTINTVFIYEQINANLMTCPDIIGFDVMRGDLCLLYSTLGIGLQFNEPCYKSGTDIKGSLQCSFICFAL